MGEWKSKVHNLVERSQAGIVGRAITGRNRSQIAMKQIPLTAAQALIVLAYARKEASIAAAMNDENLAEQIEKLPYVQPTANGWMMFVSDDEKRTDSEIILDIFNRVYGVDEFYDELIDIEIVRPPIRNLIDNI